MLNGQCHCGAVKVSYDGVPKALVRCNCSICRRLGAVWGHGSADNITIIADDDATIAYLWGDKELAFHSCKTCGCTTHWAGQVGDSPRPMAINTALVESDALKGLRERQFDGAESWTFLD